MIKSPEKSVFSFQMAREMRAFHPVLEEPIDFNFDLYDLASGTPPLTPGSYEKFAQVYGKRVNKHPLEILRELRHEYFSSAIHDSESFKGDFPRDNRYDFLESMEKRIGMIDKAMYKIAHMDTENLEMKWYTDLMIKAIFDDSGEHVKKFDKQRANISDMNRFVEGVIRYCQLGVIELPYKFAENLEKFTNLYQSACHASELFHYKQKLDADLVFFGGRITPFPHKKDHYS